MYPNKFRQFPTHSEEETFAVGEKLGKEAGPGQIFCLEGDLGTGKTVLAKGMARGLGVTDDVVSPTFTIVHEYKGRLPFYHFDIYRLEDEDELDEIGWNDYIGSDGVVLIEWADQVAEAMPKDAVWIRIEKDLGKGVDYRLITISGGQTDADSWN